MRQDRNIWKNGNASTGETTPDPRRKDGQEGKGKETPSVRTDVVKLRFDRGIFM